MVDTFGNVNPSSSGLYYSFKSRPDINFAALRLINRLPNKFKPGEINGQKVNTFLDVYFNYNSLGCN
jgi:hypothetical protein